MPFAYFHPSANPDMMHKLLYFHYSSRSTRPAPTAAHFFKAAICALFLIQFGCSSGSSSSGGSSSGGIPDPPPDPTSLTAIASSATEIDLSWASGGGTTSGYRISYLAGATAPGNCSTSGGAILIDANRITGTSFPVTSLNDDTEYSFRVCAADSHSPTTISRGVTKSATTLSLPPPNPSGLTAMPVSPSQIDLSWTSGGGATSGYRIAYRTGSDPGDCATGTVIDESSISGPLYSVTGLSANTTYYFHVCAINSNPTPDVSSGASASATTLLAPPADPMGLTAVPISAAEIDLSWSSGGGTTSGYRIAYQTASYPADCATGNVINESAISGTSYNVTGLSPGTQYFFRVCAINANITPDVSGGATASAATQALPYSLSLSVVSVSAPAVTAGSTVNVTLKVNDDSGNSYPNGGSSVIFSLGAGTSSGTFGPVTDNGNGIYTAVFTAATTGVGGATDITATIDGYAITSTPPTIDVNAGPPDLGQSVITVSSASVYAGIDVTVTATVKDQYGNQEETGGDAVSVTNSINAGESTGTMSSITDNTNGTYTATFSTTGAGTPTTISGMINGGAITSTLPTVIVIGCTVTQVTWATDPNSTITAGSNFTAGRVKLQDASNHICGTDPVTFSIYPSTNQTGASLKGTVTIAPINGYAYVTTATIQIAGTYNLLAAANSVTSPLSTDVLVEAGTATQIVFTHFTPSWPAGTGAGVVTVQLAREDAYGNIYQGPGGSATLAIDANPNLGTLSGTTTLSFSSGIATFTDLSIDNPGSGYTLSATNGSLTAISAPFDVINPSGTGLNLDVPVEMLDQSVGNRVTPNSGIDVVVVSTVGLNTADFNGAVTYYFEIVASNVTGASQTVDLYDNGASSAVPISAITVPSAVNTPTRYRSPAITLTGSSTYSIEIPRFSTGTDNMIVVYSARIIVHQVGATNTAVYVPLVSDVNTRINAWKGIIDSVSADTGISQGSPDRYAIWKKDTTNLADVQASGYTLQTVIAGTSAHTGLVWLYNESSDSPIISCTSPATASPTYCSTPDFDEFAAPNFIEGDNFDLRLQMNNISGATKIYKGGLWIRLENLSKYSTYWRTSRLFEGATTASIDQTSREMIDTANFSNPSYSHQCSGAMSSPGDLSIDLASLGIADSGTSSPASIANSGISFSSTAYKLITASGLSGIISGDRFMSEITGSTGTLDVTQCLTVISGQ
jgi:hypothetical protein